MGWGSFTVTAVSPAFVGGVADRGASASSEFLRPRAVRGALRHWLRFLAGDALDASALRRLEHDVFGGVHEGATPSASGVQVRCLRSRSSTAPFTAPNHGVRPGDRVDSNDRRYAGGVTYLGGLSFNGNERALTTVGSTATFDLRFRRNLSADHRHVHAVMASWWCLTHLGAVGARQSRGFGSLSAGATDPGWPPLAEFGAPGPSAARPPASPAELAAQLRNGLSHCQAALQHGTAGTAPDSFATLGNTSICVVDRVFASCDDALRTLGDGMFAYRHHDPDTGRVLARLGGPLKRPVWGLPLKMPDTPVFTPAVGDRWPSPVRFRVHPLVDGVALLVLASKRTPPPLRPVEPGYHAEVGGHRNGLAVTALVDDFLAATVATLHKAKSPWTAVPVWP